MYTEKKQLNWAESRIKGRIAETIVEELFRTLGFEIYPYGMENTMPQIIGKLNKIKDENSLHVRRTPDFLLFDQNKKKVHFLEVKFRASGRFSKEQVKDNLYTNVLIVLVTRKHIKCLSIMELKGGKSIIEEEKKYFLGCRKEFDFTGNQIGIIKDFCKFALKYFSSV